MNAINKIKIYLNLLRYKGLREKIKYSKNGEDLFLSNYFKDISDGRYIDVGAFHPFRNSNTYFLYKKGWSGINIDFNKTSIDLFNISRPKDYNICAAISDKVESRDFFIDHFFSPVNTIEKSFYESADKNISFKKLKRKKINTKTFEEVTREIIDIPKINFLNIDCEGHDHSVLTSFNLKKYRPDLICIETHDDDGNEKNECKDIVEMLNINNYKIFQRCGPSTIFTK